MRRPTTVGEILKEEFLIPLELTQRSLADHIGVEVKSINRLVNGGNLSGDMAPKLALCFKTSVDFWMNLQNKVDIYNSNVKYNKIKKDIRPIAL